ncbi:MAG TPA: phenylalanine--tRNA ligase subunit beta [Thermoanaerobaculia bacterium]|nr:phenylalanine--tRNA ligase subunit beta [Thermoanaerobaculia bacterium]
MKFSLDWMGDHVSVEDAGGAEGVRRLLDRGGLPVESAEGSGRDVVFDVEITPNRPDAMSHRGLAREVAAMARVPFRPAGASGAADLPTDGPPASELTSVEIQVPRLCRRFGVRVIRGTRSVPSAERVRARLASIGSKPIDAAVDATNYALWDFGQPLHAFDLDRLAGGRIVVRKAKRGERLVTLDGVERELEPSDVVVADAERAVSLAGIMGGLDTAVTEKTTNVLLEAAWWDPVAIRRTSRRLGMHTDASHRFERGADPEAIPGALDLAARLLLGAAGGTLAPGWIDARGVGWSRRRVVLRLERLRLLSGDPRLDLDFAADALARLGFAVAKRSAKRLTAEVPSWRPDVSIEEDLVEEVLRMWGYDRIPSRLPATAGAGGYLEPLSVVEEKLADEAVAAGLHETYSYPFVDRKTDESSFSAWLEATGTAETPLSVANPVDASRRDLRTTLLPGLLDAVSRNFRHGAREIGLFEVGRTFGAPGDPARPETFESRRFAFALGGEARTHWSAPVAARSADFFDAKGLFERLVERWIAPEALVWKPLVAAAFVAGAAAVCETSEGRLLGVVGVVSEAERERRRLPERVCAGEISVEKIPRERRAARFHPYSAFPPVVADLSFAQPRTIAWESIEEFARSLSLANLESLKLLDRYEGPGVADGEVKSTLRLTFRSPERTLEQEEVNRERDRLAEALRQKFGIVI